MSTKYIVNNVSGQTITGDLTINGNVVITGTTNIRPYKVYTALLTQSGGDNTQSYYGGESLTIGTTYRITGIDDGDFTIVGAPNNNINTQFVATGTTPNWGTFGENVLEYNTGAPVVTILENTIGNIWFTYQSAGNYYINSSGLFTLNKTFSNVSPNYLWESIDVPYIQHVSLGGVNDQITLKSYNSTLPSDDIIGFITQVFLEIRVYN